MEIIECGGINPIIVAIYGAVFLAGTVIAWRREIAARRKYQKLLKNIQPPHDHRHLLKPRR